MTTFNEIYAWLSNDVYNETSRIGASNLDLPVEKRQIYDGLANANWARVTETDLNIDGLTFDSNTGLYKDDGLQNGFVGAVYENTVTGEKVVVYAGTEASEGDLFDIIADISFVTQGTNPQYEDANNLYLAAQAAYGNVTVTGHSLGGALAQLAA